MEFKGTLFWWMGGDGKRFLTPSHARVGWSPTLAQLEQNRTSVLKFL